MKLGQEERTRMRRTRECVFQSARTFSVMLKKMWKTRSNLKKRVMITTLKPLTMQMKSVLTNTLYICVDRIPSVGNQAYVVRKMTAKQRRKQPMSMMILM